MNYNYNPVSGVLFIGREDEELPEYVSLKDYVSRLCVLFGFGVGMSGVITSTGPFSATMRELQEKFCERVTKNLHLMMKESGTEERLLTQFLSIVKHEQNLLRDIEIETKIGMFVTLAKKIRETFA